MTPDHDPAIVALVTDWRALMDRLDAGAAWLAGHDRTHPRYREAAALREELAGQAFGCCLRLGVLVAEREDRDIYWLANMPSAEHCVRVAGGSSRYAWTPQWLTMGEETPR